MIEKDGEEKLLEAIQSANELKAKLIAKQADGTITTVTTKKYDSKKAVTIPLDSDFF